MTPAKKNNPAYEIQISRIADSPAVDLDRLGALVQAVLKEFGADRAHVDVAIVDDAVIAEVHAQYLDDASTTDVISFDLSDDAPEGPRVFEIIVNESQAVRQSARRRLPLESELALYVTHGLLHQFGFDDHEEEPAAAMHRREDELLEQNGYGATYHQSESN